MLTSLAIAVSVVVSGVLAWAVHRYELRREPPSACAGVIDAVFSEGASTTADSLLLSQLLEHRDGCMRDPDYVEQARRLMLNTQRPNEARALLKDAEQRGTFTADELKAQVAWVDLAEAHSEWANGEESRADELRARALSSARDLQNRWPEWTQPYLILEEAERTYWKTPTGAQATDYLASERKARGRILNGAFIRDLSDWQPSVYVFLVAMAGMLGLCAAASGLMDRREMAGMSTSLIATAPEGYVELKGTLHPISDTGGAIAPESKARAVWYEVARKSGIKGSSTTYERSAERFLLRDASGDAVVDPEGITVHTTHLATRSGMGGAGLSSGGRVTERSLNVGDSVYALGQLSSARGSDGETVRRLRIADNGRRLLISNLSEGQLMFVARAWTWVGAVAFASALIVLVWSFYQRYSVINAPGLPR